MNQKSICFVTIGYFKNVGFKFEKHVCNGCHDLLTMAYSLKNIAIWSAKGTAFRCVLLGISKNESLKRLNSSVTYDRGVLQVRNEGWEMRNEKWEIRNENVNVQFRLKLDR